MNLKVLRKKIWLLKYQESGVNRLWFKLEYGDKWELEYAKAVAGEEGYTRALNKVLLLISELETTSAQGT